MSSHMWVKESKCYGYFFLTEIQNNSWVLYAIISHIISICSSSSESILNHVSVILTRLHSSALSSQPLSLKASVLGTEVWAITVLVQEVAPICGSFWGLCMFWVQRTGRQLACWMNRGLTEVKCRLNHPKRPLLPVFVAVSVSLCLSVHVPLFSLCQHVCRVY